MNKSGDRKNEKRKTRKGRHEEIGDRQAKVHVLLIARIVS
jgi:hypothetical protein